MAIIGNSVGLRIRPPGTFPNNKNYGILLEELLQQRYPEKVILVRNLCIGRATIWDILRRRNEILNVFPNYYIINLGVTDASTREIPLWFSNIINDTKESIIKKIFMGAYLYVIKPFRPQLVWLRFKATWTSKHAFRKYFEKIINFLYKGTNAQIIVMSINRPSRRIENELPGSTNNYIKINKVIKHIAKMYGAFYIDTTDLSSDIHAPDGIHLSLEGHRVIADRIYNIIEQLEEKAGPLK